MLACSGHYGMPNQPNAATTTSTNHKYVSDSRQTSSPLVAVVVVAGVD